MNNCLVTKLKSTVDNDNLITYGVISLKTRKVTALGTFSHHFAIDIRAKKPFTVTIKGTGQFYVNSISTESTGQTKTATYDSGAGTYIVAESCDNFSENDIITCDAKYALTKFLISNEMTQMFKSDQDVDMYYEPELEIISLGNQEKMKCDIEKIGQFSSKLTLLSNAYGSNNYGSIEKFVENSINIAGRTSGTCKFALYGSKVTLNGEQFFTVYEDRSELLTIAFSSNFATLTWKNNVIATYNNGVWTYNN